jgi:hypothetical protein
MPGGGRDGVLRRSGSALARLLHPGGEPAVVRPWVTAGGVRLRSESRSRDAALRAIDRMRFALGGDRISSRCTSASAAIPWSDR